MRWVLRIVWIAAAVSVFGLGQVSSLLAEPPIAATHTGSEMPMSTGGGRQSWADELFFHQWRIQRDTPGGECRLRDEYDRSHAAGTFEACCQALEQIKRQRRLTPMRGTVVLVLHGLFRTRNSMRPLCEYLQEHGAFEVLNVEYPSTQTDVAAHARSLGKIVQHLDGVEQIHLVGHSLGNIIIRRWLADRMEQDGDQQAWPTLGRVVMLGPPNQGAQLATRVAGEPLFQWLAGESGQQLGPGWPWLAMSLATPPCEFGIIAGGLQNGHGFNPLLPGDDDGTITVESTRLEGAADFLIVPVLHSRLIEDKRVLEQTLLFLKAGHFRKLRKQASL